MFDVEKLCQILEETTQVFRKGEMVTKTKLENINKTDIYMMPHQSEAPATFQKVDCHFIVVGVDVEKAQNRREELIHILDNYPNPNRLAGGPSYIEVGGELGDQELTFMLFALGEVLNLWSVITPEKLHITGEDADELAGSGMIMISGYKKS